MNEPAKVSEHASTAAPVPNPYVGILAVFLGAGLATLNSRLLSVGLPDLRGALGLSFDDASWLPTALNMATMFSGVFVVFVNAFWGPRRILLPMAAVFMTASLLLPFAPGYWAMVLLLIIAGASSGTFYSLTMTFVLTTLPKRLIIFGIAAYAADIVFVSNIASLLEGWYIEYLSWRWIFWTAALFTPVMMACVYYGIPRRAAPVEPKPSWQGFIYFSVGLALLYGAMDQGERLDWSNSGTIVAMSAAGIFLLGAALVRRISQPNPVLNLKFLSTRNIVILAFSIFVFKFMHLAAIVLVPGFLSNIQRYRPLETGHTLAWVALPMFILVWLVAILVVDLDARLVLAMGLGLGGACCWLWSHVDTSWAGNTFEIIELVMSGALACSYIGLVSCIVLEGLEAGALTSAANAATLSGFMHLMRIFGGQVGVAVMTRVLTVREKFHSNILVQMNEELMSKRVQALTSGMTSSSTGPGQAQQRAVAILSQQVRAQAYTLANSDGFILITYVVVLFGSTNFSFRGIYIQANNMLVFSAPEVVSLFADYFQQAFDGPAKGFSEKPVTQHWHDLNIEGRPPLSLCFAPHNDASLSLDQIGDAIKNAESSVFFCIAFLSQMTSGAVLEAVNDLETRDLFSYGISERKGGLSVHKPDGTDGIVSFAYLAKIAPEPFKSEWAAGTGPSQIHEHDKFVVVDFNLPTARVYTGSCNMSVNGEEKNGDNLICIRDPRVATSYAIEAIRIFDHLEFRSKMQASETPKTLTLAKPTTISGKPTWFERFYGAGSQAERDRQLFSH